MIRFPTSKPAPGSLRGSPARDAIEAGQRPDPSPPSSHLPPTDLDTLCREQPLVTRERHPVNDVYGQATILKRYARLPQRYRLKAVIEHGISLGDRMMPYDRDALLPYVLSPSQHRAAFVQQECGKRAIPIGASFLYAQRLFDDKYGPADDHRRRGTIVFPCHSTNTTNTQFDHEDYACRLRSLPAEFHPVTVCMYWKDYLAGTHRYYQDGGGGGGLSIVSAGHMYRPDFLLRLYELCRGARYAAANRIGAHVFLSVVSGCRYFYLQSSEISYEVTEEGRDLVTRLDPSFQAAERESLRLFGHPVAEITPQQRAFVDRFVGTEYRRTPAELRRLLLAAECKYRFGPTRLKGDSWATSLVPLYWRRQFRKIRYSKR